MVLLLRKLYLYFIKDPEGAHYFPGGVHLFSKGGGVQMLISIETHIRTCYFPGGGGVLTPYPLWIRTWAISSLRDNIYHSPPSNHACQALVCQD